MLALMPSKPRPTKPAKPESTRPQERESFSTAPTILDSLVAQLMDSKDPRSELEKKAKNCFFAHTLSDEEFNKTDSDEVIEKKLFEKNKKIADQILSTLHTLDTIPSFAQRVAYINDRASKGAIDNDVYRAFSLGVIKFDIAEDKLRKDKEKVLPLPDQTPLKWAYYWRRTNALVDELEKPGGIISYGDIKDLRDRFHSEPPTFQSTIRDRIGGEALSLIGKSDSERARNQLSLNRIVQTAEILFDEEQARIIRYSHDLATKLHDMGEFTVKSKAHESPELTRGIMQVLTERMMPHIGQAVRAQFRGEQSDLTPEETGILSVETKSLLYFLVESERHENKEIRQYLWQLIEDQKQLEQTIALAQKGIPDEYGEKKYALEASLASNVKKQLTEQLAESKESIQTLQSTLSTTDTLDPVTAKRVLRYIHELDTRDTLTDVVAAIEVNPSRERRERARIADALNREERARSWAAKETAYATLKAEIKGRAMLEYVDEQREKLGEESESRRSTGKSSRLRHKRQSLIGELHKISVFKERLLPLSTELKKLNDAESRADQSFTTQLERLKERHDELSEKRKLLVKDKAELMRLVTEIARVSAEWTQSKADCAKKRERITRSMQPIKQVISEELAVQTDLTKTEEQLARILRYIPKTRLDRIRDAQKRADDLLAATGPSTIPLIEDEAVTEDEDVSLLNPNWRMFYRPGRKRGQGTGSIVDHVLARLAKDAEHREERKALRQEIRGKLLDILNSQFGTEPRESVKKLDQILDDVHGADTRVEIANNEAMELFGDLQKNVRTMFTFENDGPIIYWQDQRLRVPKFLASRLADRLIQHLAAHVNATWSLVKKDLSDQARLADMKPALKDLSYLGTLQQDINAYTSTYSGPKMTRQERKERNEAEDDEKRIKITQLLLPTFQDRVARAIEVEYTDDDVQRGEAKKVLDEIMNLFNKRTIADEVLNTVYYPYDSSAAYRAYDDEYGSHLADLLIDAFDSVFPASVLKNTEE